MNVRAVIMYPGLHHDASCAASWFLILISPLTDFNEAFAERSLNEALLNCNR